MAEQDTALSAMLRRFFIRFWITQAITLVVFAGFATAYTAYYNGRLAEQLAAAFRPSILSGDTRQIMYDMSDSVTKNFSSMQWRPASGQGAFSIPAGVKAVNPYVFAFASAPLFYDENNRVSAGDLRFYYNRWSPIELACTIWAILFALSLFLLKAERRRIISNYNTVLELQVKESKFEMAAQVAHDIRSPLAALGASTKGLNITADQRTLVDGAIGRIQAIADDLLMRYRAPGAEVKAKPETCALAGLIEQILIEKRIQHKDKAGVKIVFSGGDGIKAAVDQRELQRVVSNLLNNAIEAIERSGTVAVSLTSSNGQVLLEIRDDAKGIPLEILAKLGQKGETHGKSGGTGLGLYHARTSVESWGGGLAIASEIGKGTVVTITLPSAAKPAAGLRTVLLDDDPLVHMNWKMAAKAAGADLKLFKTPQELSAAAETLPRDIHLYIDSELGDAAKGEDIAKELHDKGFTDITMATGHAAANFAHLPWLKVAGKEPPWA